MRWQFLRPHLPLLRAALVVALVTVIAIALAYQVRSRVFIDVGRIRDDLYLRNFNDRERDENQDYRWTKDSSQVELQGEPLATPWTLTMRLNGYRPNRIAELQLGVSDTLLDELRPPGDWEVYTFSGQAGSDAWAGNTRLTFENDVFVPKDELPGNADPRALGIVVDWIEWMPARSSAAIGNEEVWLDAGQLPVVPPGAIALSWALAFSLLYVTARGIGLPARPINLLFAIAIILLALGVAFLRPYVTHWTYAFLMLAILLALAAAVLYLFVPRFGARLGLELDAVSRTALCAIVLLSVALKGAGVWYPQFQSSDLTFHAHRLAFVSEANLFFTSELPDAARRVVPYPPALYVLLSPLIPWLTEYPTLLLAANILAEAVAILALYFAARKILEARSPSSSVRTEEHASSSPTALFAAFLFALNPVTFWIYSWGNHTNIFGQVAATLLFCLLLTQSVLRPRNFLLALFLLALASTAHLGIFLSLLVFFPLLVVIQLVQRGANGRRESAALGVLFLLGVVLAWGLYYAEFVEPLWAQTQIFVQDFSAGRAGGAGRGVSFERIRGVALVTVEQVGWVLLLCGIAGFPLSWKALGAHARSVWLAWLLVALVFGIVTVGSSFSTRYTLWAAPALALGGGLFLGWLAARSRAAQFAAYALCLVAIVTTAWVWIDRVLNAYQ